MEATCGSTILLGAKPEHEDPAITRLREAGAVILGKTNLFEWGGFPPGLSTSGWTPRGGLTKGAYYENMKSGGSSGGSAVATSLGLCFAALDGSLVSPTGRNGVVGFKPTVGLVSSKGVIPISKKQDTTGPITRTVTDAAHILNTIRESSNGVDYTEFCRSNDMHGRRIGVPRTTFPMDEDRILMACFEESLDIVSSAGAIILDNVDFKGAEKWRAMDKKQKEVHMAGAIKDAIAKYLDCLASNPHNLRTIHDLNAASKADPREALSDRGSKNWDWVETINTMGAEYHEAVAKAEYFAGEGGVLGAMERYDLDVIAIPYLQVTAVQSAARGGLPLVTVPMGKYPEGTQETYYQDFTVDVGPCIPFCITFISRSGSEDVLFSTAYAVEQLTKVRQSLRLYNAPTIEIGSSAQPLKAVKV